MRTTALVCFVLAAIAMPAQGRPVDPSPLRQPMNGPTPWLDAGSSGPAKSATDTFYLYGGPGTWEGKFENLGGPDWQDWTHRDLNIDGTNDWQISTYYAANLNGHGPGNRAMYCGNPDLPACSPADSVGGVDHNMFEDLVWRSIVPDPQQSLQVDLTFTMNYDLPDAGWDFLEIWLRRSDSTEMLAQWTGSEDNVTVEQSVSLEPGDFYGPEGDQVVLVLRVWSDGAWDDRDCFSASHGACQIDDITVSFDGEAVTFDDFEEGNPVHWEAEPFTGVGDFSSLRRNLDDLDPCRDNSSYQVNFIDDGMVVPGTGGTPCITWCYGPGGWIVNNTGGLLADDNRDWFLENQIESPPIPWQPGLDAGIFSFDVYVHEELCSNCPGVFYTWHVRSTASSDPADLELALWRDRNFVHYGGPVYRRHDERVGDLLVENPQWIQLALEVNEMGWVWGWNGADGTPAPYFDNVAFKAWQAQGPEILVDARNNFGDSFPENGQLDPADPAANWCRVDIIRDLNLYGLGFNGVVRGDSLVASVTSPRAGAELTEAPRLQWILKCNPEFDEVRGSTPGPEGILRGSVAGYSPSLNENQWAFDLPDTGWFYPGDALHYYLTAQDDLVGQIQMSVWPADTTGVLDFSTSTFYPSLASVRALPTALPGDSGSYIQPPLLVCDDAGSAFHSLRLVRALDELGFVPGVDYDLFTVDKLPQDQNHGMQAVPAAILDSYPNLLYTSGAEVLETLTRELRFASTDVDAVLDWLAGGDRRALFMGEGLAHELVYSAHTRELLEDLGVEYLAQDISQELGGPDVLQIWSVAGNGVLPDAARWPVIPDCNSHAGPNAVTARPEGLVLAGLDPAGATGGPYASVVVRDNLGNGNRTAFLPLDISRVQAATAGFDDGVAMSGRAYLLRELLDWLGASGTGFSAVPEAGKFAVSVYPNPFNPRTEISFSLPRAGHLSLKVYDLRGRLVRTLADSRREAGPGREVWDGLDASGSPVPSGVYFYEARAADEVQVGKVTLLK